MPTLKHTNLITTLKHSLQPVFLLVALSSWQLQSFNYRVTVISAANRKLVDVGTFFFKPTLRSTLNAAFH